VSSPVTIADVRAAAARIAPHVVRTPLVESPAIGRVCGADVWLKLECRQVTGSFKPRGALNALALLSDEARAAGLVAASAGNHALGVAHACGALGVDRATLFVQANAARAKLDRLREYPVELRLVGQTYDEAEQAARAHADSTGATFVSAYDDPAVVAGQGTVGLEILDELPDVDTVVVPVGGGALSAGVALAVTAVRPGARVVGVNPQASPSALESFRRGAAIDPYEHGPTRAHGLAGGYGRIPYAVARDRIDEIVLVSEAEIERAIVALIDGDQVLAEASGAAAVGAVLAGAVTLGRRVAIIVSGGNIDSATLRDVLSDGPL